jgi:DNA-binding HxlR family transcriptional regulator
MRRTASSDAALLRRLRAIEQRLKRLEGAGPRASRRTADAQDLGWMLEGLRARIAMRGRKRSAGRLGYAGIVETPAGSRYAWRGEHPVEDLLAADWSECAPSLAALGHRVRLDILRALIGGASEVSQLQRQPGLGTSGQLYHHLRELQAAGWVRQQERSRYVVVPDRVVATLLLMGVVMGPEPGASAPPRKGKRR